MYRTVRVTLPIFLALLFFVQQTAEAQKRWDGGAGDGQWSSPANWMPDGVPAASDSVLIDNTFFAGNYSVLLPLGPSTQSLLGLTILPSAGDTIALEIPVGNTATPALNLLSNGDALILGAGAILRNASGAASGETINMQGQFRILDGGHYIHQTSRANASIINHLSTDIATQTGIFEFDVPGNAGYTVSLTGNQFGTLRFSADAAGGTKSYSGSGSTDLNVRGKLDIAKGAQLTSTMTADIRVGGDLVVEGTLNLQPVTAGSTGRSLLFTGNPAWVQGTGTITPGTHFRNFDIQSNSSVILERYITTSLPGQSVWLRSNAILDLGEFLVSGSGSFHSEPGATLRIGSPEGITLGDSGNLRTATRQLDPGMTYAYSGQGMQSTGNALPSSIAELAIDKPSGPLRLSRNLEASRVDFIQGLLLTTDSTALTLVPTGIHSQPDAYGRTDEGWDGSHIAGPFIMRTSGPGTWRAPIGDTIRSMPLALIRSGEGEVLYTVEYHSDASVRQLFNGSSGTIDDHEYWSAVATGTSPMHDAFLDLAWRSGVWPSIDSIGAANLRLVARDSTVPGNAWTQQQVIPTIENFGKIGWIHSGAAFTRFEAFTLGAGAPQSVLALTPNLQCRTSDEGTLLSWTEAGIPEELLQVEASVDGQHFSSLSTLPMTTSTFMDKRVVTGDTWYRLSYPHGAGGNVHSNTCRVHHNLMGSWKIYPQPASDHIKLEAPEPLLSVRFRLRDISGRVLTEGILPDGKSWNISTRGIKPGIHVLEVFHVKGSFTRALVMAPAK